MKKFFTAITIASCIFHSVSLLGAGETVGDFISVANGNWSSSTSWNIWDGTAYVATTTFPGDTATPARVIIKAGTSIIIDVSPTYSIGNLVINKNLTFDGNSNNTLVIDGLIRLNTNGTLSVGNGTGSANTIYIGDFLNDFGTVEFFKNDSLYCDVVFDGTSNSKIRGNDPQFHNITVAKASNATCSIDTVVTIHGHVEVTSGILSNGGHEITLAAGKNLKVYNGATLQLTDTTTMIGVSGGGNKIFEATSTVDYSGTNQIVTAESYGHLVLRGSGTKTLPAATLDIAGDFSCTGAASTSAATNPINIDGNVTLSGSGAFNAGSATITVGGGWSKSGSSFTPSTSTVVFSGSTDAYEDVGGSNPNTFYNLTIDGSTISLGNAVAVDNTLTLTSENIYLNNYDLTLSISNGLSGGSSSSYIVTNGTGRVVRTIGGAAAYLFPLGGFETGGSIIGTDATYYNPATITWSSSPGSTEVSGRFVNSQLTDPTGLTSDVYGGTTPTPIVTFLDNGYWDLNRTGAPNAFDLALESNGVTNMGVALLQHSIFHNTTTGPTGWGDAGSIHNAISFTSNYINLSSEAVNDFGYFGIGRSEDDYVLPIELVTFAGSNVGNANILNWTTATELNNDYFTIERSADGKQFEAIGTVAGAGQSSGLKDYTFTDKQPLLGTNYYRLRQTDFNGLYEFSDIISVKVNGNFDLGTIYPNPAVNSVILPVMSANSGNTTLRILDMSGRVVYAEVVTISEGIQTISLNMSGLTSGMYLCEIEIDGVAHRQPILKQ